MKQYSEELNKPLVIKANDYESELKEDKLYDVLLFNKPLWLPIDIFRPGEPGHLNIYGVLSPIGVDRKCLDAAYSYLGYLSMCEECEENGESPSGFKTVNGDCAIWEDREGNIYNAHCSELDSEREICREKANLKITNLIEGIHLGDINYGLYNGFIISHELYEHLLENSTKIGS